MMDTKRLRERTDVLSFFINIPILERGSGMKSYSQFITEKKKSEGPEGVNQADVSKKAAKYRRAERAKGATGGKTTGSLSKGTLSFPGDRSGATTRVKADLEARKGFSDSKSGGLKADETSKFVDRSVRQQRTIKQGTPDPFDPKTPKAPSRPFKSLTKSRRTRSTSIPDPFKSLTTIPKTVQQTPANKYIRSMQDKGIRVNQDFVDAQGLKASGAKPEMIGKKAPSGAGARFRASADATKDISKATSTDLDKALKNLTTTGNVKGKSTGVSGGLAAPKGGVRTSPGVGPKSYSKSEKTLQNMQRQMAQTGVDSSGKKLSTSERKRAFNISKNPRAVERAVDNPPSKTFKSGKTSVGSKLSKGGKLALPGQKGLPPTKIKLPKAKPELASKVKDALPGFKEVRKGSQTLKSASKLSKLARGAGRLAGPALAVVGAGLDYADDRAKGYNRTSSALRTGAKHLGGAAGAALGSVAGPLGTAAGYAAGHWLTSKVLDKFHKPSKPKTPKQPTGKDNLRSAASGAASSIPRALTGAPPKTPPTPKKVKTNPKDYLKVNR